jgi:hypothetical protein
MYGFLTANSTAPTRPETQIAEKTSTLTSRAAGIRERSAQRLKIRISLPEHVCWQIRFAKQVEDHGEIFGP